MQFLDAQWILARRSFDSKVDAEVNNYLDRRRNSDTRDASWQSGCGHAGKEVGSRQKHNANALSRSMRTLV